jgi:probable HAF family extracellular repeat protein
MLIQIPCEGDGKMKKVLGNVAMVAMIVLLASSAMAQPTATIEWVDPGVAYQWAQPMAMTNDGQSFVGQDYFGGVSFIWTADDGFFPLGASEVWDIADNGTIIGNKYMPHPDFPEDVSQAAYYQDGVWTALDGWPVTPFDANWYTHAYSIARETGDKIVGMAWVDAGHVNAYEWTFDNGWNTLERAEDDSSSYKAMYQSGDGSLVVGWDEQTNGCRTAQAWFDGVGAPVGLGTLCPDETWPHGEPMNPSDNGMYVTGGSITGFEGTEAFLWTEQDGMQLVGMLPGFYDAYGTAVSNDGQVVGWSSDAWGPWGTKYAFHWDVDNGIQTLADYLTSMGAAIPEGYHIDRAIDMSNDGRYILGSAIDADWNNVWFIATIEEGDPIPVELTLTPTTTIVPAAGGDVVYDASIVSTLGNPMNGRAWTVVALPNGQEYTTMNIPITVTPGTRVISGLVQSVPALAPEGTYTFTANLGNYPTFIGATDSFTFEKTGVAADGNDNWDASEWTIASDEMAAVELPSAYQIAEIAPNPFNPTTTITLALPAASELNLRVVNVLGQQVAELANGKISAGNHSFVFDGANLSSGVYFVHAVVPGEMNQIQKITLMK